MSGLNFSLGGKLDRSFQGSLKQAEAEARASGLRIQNSLRTQISGIDKRLSRINPLYSEYGPLTDKREGLSRALLIAQNAQFTASARARVAEKETAGWKQQLAEFRAKYSSTAGAAGASEKVAENIGKAARHAGGLNLIIRETLVVFREIGRGNWTRIPGSLSLIAQGFSQLKNIPLLLMGAWTLAIGALVGSFFIFYHRVKTLTAELRTSLVELFNPEHIAKYLQKANLLVQLEKDVAAAAQSTKEAHDGVTESLDRQLDLTRDRLAYELELLELQKQNALAAVRNPAEREAIEKRFSQLISAKKKEERDAEVKKMQDEVRQLPDAIEKTKGEIKRLTEGDFVSDARDEQILHERQKAAEAYDDYRKQLKPGEKDSRENSSDKDRKIISDFNRKQAKFNQLVSEGNSDQMFFVPTEQDRAKADAARARLADADRTQKSLNEWVDTKDNRERARLRVKELEERVKAEEKRLTELGPRGGGIIEDTIKRNLAKDQQDLQLERERLKRVDPGRPLSGREVTERQRVGLGSPQIALLDVNKSMDRKLGILVQHAQTRSTVGGNFGNRVPEGHGE